jgi:hypothetical protein
MTGRSFDVYSRKNYLSVTSEALFLYLCMLLSRHHTNTNEDINNILTKLV